MADIIRNPTPKQRFLSNPTWINKHRELIVSDDFQRAVDYGMNQYQVLLANQTTDDNSAMAVGFKLTGALELIQTIRLLSELPKVQPATVQPQLDHSV